MTEQLSDLAVIGLATMGQNIALNIADNGYDVIVYNRTEKRTHELMKENPNVHLHGKYSLADVVKNLKRPRKLLLMIKAGQPIDEMISQLIPLLEEGDILIDGGNSHYEDTKRRKALVNSHNVQYVGMGISGGEEGARKGPSLMPGGDKTSWEELRPVLENISAKTEDNLPCVAWIGSEGSGHFVKMVHNGIEYGLMQLIAEAYDFLKHAVGLDNEKISEIFFDWNNNNPLLKGSYLLEITQQIFSKKDEHGLPLIDQVLDVAKQKGTGKWTSSTALDLGVPLGIISQGVDMRVLSSGYERRQSLAEKYPMDFKRSSKNSKELIKDLENALLMGMVLCFSQGFDLLQEASSVYGWNLSLEKISSIWKAGCIIRCTKLLDLFEEAFSNEHHSSFSHLLSDEKISKIIKENETHLRSIVTEGISLKLTPGAFSSALAYFDAIRRKRLPTNLIQAQRDFFGAHTFEKISEPRGKEFHADWSS